MVCKYCKTELVDTAIFCHICGKKQSSRSRQRRHRAQSQGTITKLSGRRANPYWARLPAEYSSAIPVRKSLGCYPTYSDASEALAKAMYTPDPVPENHVRQAITVQTVYERFRGSHYFESLSKSAQTSHKSAWKHLSSIAEMPISQINKDTFQVPIQKMEEKGLKRETLAKVRNLSSLLCKEAMGMGLISVNYGQMVQLPKNDTEGATPFSTSALKAIWAAADKGNKDAQAVLLMTYTGMRPNESLGVDIEAHLHIVGEYWYIKTGSKTAAGQNRLIPIPNILREVVNALVNGRMSGPLIAAEKGGYHRVDNWRSRHFNPLMEALGLVGYVPYSCRHTYADIQKRRNIDPEVQMRIMGHTDYATTVERYQTTTEEDISRICDAVADMQRCVCQLETA